MTHSDTKLNPETAKLEKITKRKLLLDLQSEEGIHAGEEKLR